MRRGSRFLIGLATAGLAFGTLMLTFGPGQFNKYGYRHHGCYNHQAHHCDALEDCHTQE